MSLTGRTNSLALDAADRPHIGYFFSTGADLKYAVYGERPVADAGADRSTSTQAVVMLDGSASTDPDGDLPLLYWWTQTGGPTVVLNAPSLATPAFTAPSSPVILTFPLAVTDSLGLPGTMVDEVVVTVEKARYRFYLPLSILSRERR